MIFTSMGLTKFYLKKNWCPQINPGNTHRLISLDTKEIVGTYTVHRWPFGIRFYTVRINRR